MAYGMGDDRPLRRARQSPQQQPVAIGLRHRMSADVIEFGRENPRQQFDRGVSMGIESAAVDARAPGQFGNRRRGDVSLRGQCENGLGEAGTRAFDPRIGSEEDTSELQSLMRISYAVFCLKKKT